MISSQTASEMLMLSETEIVRMMPSERITTYGDQLHFARAIEQAVRAQWAAEVERLESLVNEWMDEETKSRQKFLDAKSERDAAQDEVARLRRDVQLLKGYLNITQIAQFHRDRDALEGEQA